MSHEDVDVLRDLVPLVQQRLTTRQVKAPSIKPGRPGETHTHFINVTPKCISLYTRTVAEAPKKKLFYIKCYQISRPRPLSAGAEVISRAATLVQRSQSEAAD